MCPHNRALCSGYSKECQVCCHCSLMYTITQRCKPPLDQATQVDVKLELQAPSLPCRCKIPSSYFEANAQPEQHSNVDDFYRQIYFKIVETVANINLESIKRITLCTQTVSRLFWKELWSELASQNVDQLCEF